METRPDITFEYDYIRVVYELIISNLRITKKHIEKDLNLIINKLNSIRKKKLPIDESRSTISALIGKVEHLESKYEKICNEEQSLFNCLSERLTSLKLIDGENYSYENVKFFCDKKLNNLLLEFFLRERFLETAKNYIEEEKINVLIINI